MRISGVELTTHLEDHRQTHLLVLRSDSGLSGVGELATSDGGADAERSASVLADLLIGRDPFEVEALLTEATIGADGTMTDVALISAATSAMLDLAGQSLGTPVHQLLGGRVRDDVRACAVDWTEGATTPAELVGAARRTVASGFTVLRVEPFAGSSSGPETRVASATDLIRAVRDAVPDEVDLIVQADSGLTPSEEMEFADALGPLEPMWLEVSVSESQRDSLQRLAESVTLPLAAGRGASAPVLKALAAGNLVDYLVLEVGRVGGLVEARRIAALAEVYHTAVIPIGSGGSLSLGVALELAAVVPNLALVELRPGFAAVPSGMVSVDGRPRFSIPPGTLEEGT
jgi:galactonate dehydratase